MSETPVVSAPVNTAPESIPAVPMTGNDSKTPSEATQKVEAPQTYEVKVNGQIRKYTLDQLMSKASLGEAATERFEQAKQLTQKSQKFQENIKKDFLKALQDPELGLSKDQIKERFEHWYKENYIDPEVMSPEQKELAELKRWRKEREAEEAERNELAQKEQETLMDSQTRETVQQEIIKALETSGLPKTRETVARMAFYMKQNLMRGYDAPMELVVQQVKESVSQNWEQYFKDATVEQWVSIIGEEGIKKLRQYDLERLKNKFGSNAVQANETEAKPKLKRGEKIPMSRVDDYLNDIRQQK